MTDESFDDLFRRAKEGDRDAIEELFLLHHHRVLLLVHQHWSPRLSRHFTPNDALQEVFLRYRRHIGRLRNEGQTRFFAWLATTARSVVLDLHRWTRARVRDRTYFTAFTRTRYHVPASITTASFCAVRNEMLDHLSSKMKELPPVERRIVTLKFLEGRTFAEIAAGLRMSKSTVEDAMKRGLEILRRGFRGLGYTSCF
jgi:RNA polymerase sigma-70 factor (ECF subfamily)